MASLCTASIRLYIQEEFAELDECHIAILVCVSMIELKRLCDASACPMYLPNPSFQLNKISNEDLQESSRSLGYELPECDSNTLAGVFVYSTGIFRSNI